MPKPIPGDESRLITVELPTSFEDLEHSCVTSFGMVGPVTIYRHGVANLTREEYNKIEAGDQLVVVDSRGNALDMKKLFVSTHDRDFGVKPLPKRTAPVSKQRYHKAPDGRDFSSEASKNYKAWALPKRQQRKQAQRAKSLPFNARSTSQDAFVPHKVSAHRAHRPQQYKPNNVRFNGQSTASADYKEWALPRKSAPRRAATPPPSKPFNARSTAQDDFKAHQLPPRDARPEPQAYRQTPDGRNFASEASQKFKAWDLPKRQKPRKVQRSKSLPFNARTTVQDDFVRYAQKPRKALRPSVRPLPNAPFDGRTVSRDDYQPYKIPRKHYITIVPAL